MRYWCRQFLFNRFAHRMMTFNLTFPSLCLTLEPQLVLLYRSFSPETANFLKISMFCYRPKHLLIRELFKEKVKITSSSIVSLLLNDAKKWASIKTQYNGVFPTFGAGCVHACSRLAMRPGVCTQGKLSIDNVDIILRL